MERNPRPENKDELDAICNEIIEELLASQSRTKKLLNSLKIKYCRKHGFHRMPRNAEILERAGEEEKEVLSHVLRRRRTRTAAGVSVIAVMTKPIECPGKCLYCPGKSSQPNEAVAQSYTGREPAAMRSIHNDYDPFRQVSSRIRDLEAIGHTCDKIEIIVMGGTFLSTPADYQEDFVKGCIDGVLGMQSQSLTESKTLAEESYRRIIGITFETRPDYCGKHEIDAMLGFGGTRVEIGVQTMYDDIYTKMRRGHDTNASKEAIQLAKDAGLKVCLHLMPNLPGSNLARDEEMFKVIFSDESYRPDYLKIYPCLVVKGTDLETWWKNGEYIPYPQDQLVNLLADVKASIPSWIRIQRVQRDIPAYLILDGVKQSNFREIIWERMKEKGLNCNCIRCREFGFSHDLFGSEGIPSIDSLSIGEENYIASGGEEYFISAIHPPTNTIFGYVRVRKPSPLAHRPEMLNVNSAIIRELRVVGEIVPVNEIASKLQVQHRGLGKKLVDRAEIIAKERYNAHKMIVIAGLGAKPYFYNLGYSPDGPYVSKSI